MAAVTDALQDLDYVSHVKEEVAGTDDAMYTAMLGCWTALYRLQRPDPPTADWWTKPADGADGDIADLTSDLADRMMRLDSDPVWADDPLPVRSFPTGLAVLDDTECLICGNELNSGDDYVMLPEDEQYGEPEGPAHAECATAEGWKVQS
jgi:hypothetical protein